MSGFAAEPPADHREIHIRRCVDCRRALMVAAILSAAAAGVAAIVVTEITPEHRPAQSLQVALGTRRFDAQKRHCRLRAAHRGSRDRRSAPLLLGLEASVRLFRGRSRCEQIRLAQQTGVRALREDLPWAEVEPRRSRFHWGPFDAVVRAVTAGGLTLLPVLDDPPAWAAPTRNSLPSDRSAFDAFVAAVVSRYGPGGAFWRANPRLARRPLLWFELWNEPWNASDNGEPGIYARLVRAAVIAGRAANPGARFLIDAETGYRQPNGQTADWLSGMYDAVPDLGDYFDAVSVHPYGGSPSVYVAGDALSPPEVVETVRREMVAHGDGYKPLWVTEVGWSTCSGAAYCVTDRQQADYLREFLDLARTSWQSYVRAVFVYDLRDAGGHQRDDKEAWYGLLAPDLSRKPAWYVLHAAAG